MKDTVPSDGSCQVIRTAAPESRSRTSLGGGPARVGTSESEPESPDRLARTKTSAATAMIEARTAAMAAKRPRPFRYDAEPRPSSAEDAPEWAYSGPDR